MVAKSRVSPLARLGLPYAQDWGQAAIGEGYFMHNSGLALRLPTTIPFGLVRGGVLASITRARAMTGLLGHEVCVGCMTFRRQHAHAGDNVRTFGRTDRVNFTFSRAQWISRLHGSLQG
jgi:hypothetical protein